MFHVSRKARVVFGAALLGLLLVLLAACSSTNVSASAATSSDALTHAQSASTQQAATSSVLSLNVQPYPTPFTVYEVGSTMSHVVATGTDNLGPGDPITATIDWGDNTTPTQYTFIDGRTFQVSGAHAYSKVGTYTITVTAAIVVFQQSTSGTGTINVVPDYTLNVHALKLKPGRPFSGVVATGTDPFPNDSLQGSIDWGDGTAPTSVQATSSSQGSFQVNGTHTYNQFGSYTITVSLTSTIVGPIQQTGTALVSNLTLTVNTLHARAGQPFTSKVATVKGLISAQGLRVVIVWGDGTTSKFMLAGGTSSIKIKGSHTYSQAGTYGIIVLVKDNGTGDQTHANGTATVA